MNKILKYIEVFYCYLMEASCSDGHDVHNQITFKHLCEPMECNSISSN